MSSPYVGEIRMFAGSFAPAGWAFCDGATMAISENDTLFNLIGTTYGGDGQTTFNLPDLRGRVPVHPGGSLTPQGLMTGQETVTVTTPQLPNHTHTLTALNSTPGSTNPQGMLLAEPVASIYNGGANFGPMNASSIVPAGGNQPHNNLQPYLCVSFIISLFGIYPTPT